MAHSKEIIRMPNLISRERVTQESGKNVIQPVLRPQFVDVVCIFSVKVCKIYCKEWQVIGLGVKKELPLLFECPSKYASL